jgi:hypothetical protein
MKWTTSTTFLSVLAPFLAAGAPVPQDAPVIQPVEPASSYIITLKPGVDVNASATHISWAGDLQRRSLAKRQEQDQELKTFDLFDFKGYAGVFDDDTLAEIEASDEVSYLPVTAKHILTKNRLHSSRRTFLATCQRSSPRTMPNGDWAGSPIDSLLQLSMYTMTVQAAARTHT